MKKPSAPPAPEGERPPFFTKNEGGRSPLGTGGVGRKFLI